ncbi:MAG: Gfo/Idh/MocA family oxidoreductase [Planctomycetota bacterium]
MTETDRRTFLIQSAGALAGIALLPDLSLSAPTLAAEGCAVGVVGIGRQGRAIIGELQKIEGIRIAAICDSDPGRLKAGQGRVAGANAYATHRELLDKEKDVQAIFIATPTHLHSAIVVDATQAGRHVYCEAPLAHTAEDARIIADAARASAKLFHCGYEGRSNPIYKLARTFYKTEAVRDLISIYAQHQRKTSWRTAASDPARDAQVNWRLDPNVSIGLAGELGSHQYDVVNWYLGRLPERVRGTGAVRFYQDGRTIADTIRLTFTYADGIEFAHHATLANSYGGAYETFHGSNAAIKLAWSHGWMFKEADAPTQGWEVYANRQQFHNDEGITLIADATKLASQGKLKEGIGLPHPALYYAVGDFLSSVTTGKPVSCGIEDGLIATLMGIAANRAILTREDQMLGEQLKKGG